ncbi:MAG: OB-fold domain-containing protein [Gammaproteobacteria bacterium]|nr:OB-fold domain-containing protein [Gammaproteobacteria bacterium]
MAEPNTPPADDVALAPYHAALAERRLLIKRCAECGKPHFYPRPYCPFCLGDKTEWEQASGAGTVYSWSVERRAKPPYVIAFVTLAEGPTLLTNLVGIEPDAVAIGQAVTLDFEERDGVPTPVFRPAG